jgi:SsrA-binding protein
MADLIYNKKAGFNYEITDTLVAGIELFGFEVKALRKNQGSLDGSYVTVRGGEALLMNAQIPPFQQNNTPKEYDPRRERRLLLTKTEITSLASSKSLTAVPISLYNSGRKIKVKIGLAQSKKKFDKRETIKKRETDRDIRREFRDR